MSQPASRLGKGLSALIRSKPTTSTNPPADEAGLRRHAAGEVDSHAQPPSASPERSEDDARGERVQSIRIDLVRPNPRQPRVSFDEVRLAELAESIRISGVIQPILVRSADGGGFELIAGERRLRAARMAGREDIPAIVRNMSDAESVEAALVENLQREDLGPLERAGAYQQYIETYRVSPEELAERLGESRSNVVNYIRLLKLSPELREMLERAELSMGHARALAGIVDATQQLALARMAARRNLSVRQVEALAQRTPHAAASSGQGDSERTGAQRHFRLMAEAFSKALGAKVDLIAGRGRNCGRIVIRFDSLEQFEHICERLDVPPRLD